MKKIVFMMMLLAGLVGQAAAQTARQVMDKTAKNLSQKSGVQANFKLTNSMGSTSGTIAVKGSKFHATTPQAVVWFDGKTQWTYMKKNEEVNVVTPTAAQLQAVNPYTFINMYKEGYKLTMNTTATAYVVHLTATSATHKIREMFVTVGKKDYIPSQVKMLQNKKWVVFDISNFQKKSLPDTAFRFNQKDFPSAEVIDLR